MSIPANETAKQRLARILAERKKANAQATTPAPVQSTGANTGASKELAKLPAERPAGDAIPTLEESKVRAREMLATATGSNSAGTTDSVQQASNSPTATASPAFYSKVDQHPLYMRLVELREAMMKSLPEHPYILKKLHDEMKADTEIVTMMTEEEIGSVVASLIHHTNTTIVAAPKKTTRKKSQPIALDMLD